MSIPQVWSDCIDQLRDVVSEADFDQWLMPVHAVQQGTTLKLIAPNRYTIDHIKKNLLQDIKSALHAINSGIETVSVAIGTHSSADSTNSTSSATNGTATDTATTSTTMDPRYTFDKHIEGDSNHFARAAALQVGEHPGHSYNPLFIYGDTGLGKTHLMQAAGHLMLRAKPRTKVLYLSSEHFVNDMIKALKNNTMQDFKHRYRSLGALLIDDVQFFIKKDRSQEEFFHTFTTLLEAKRQIIITSDRIPNAISGVDDRLISRFSTGLTVHVEPPDLETRIAILEHKAQINHQVELPREVSSFVANAVRSNVRELEGALCRITARAQVTGRPLDLDLARDALRDLLAHRGQQLNIDNIQRVVAEYYKLRIADMTSKSRRRPIVRPRQLAMYLAQLHTDLSLPAIGNHFGGRNHSTVLHAKTRIPELIQTTPKLADDLNNLQRLLGV